MNSFRVTQYRINWLPAALLLLSAIALALPTHAQQNSTKSQQGTPDYFEPAGFVDEALAFVVSEVSLAEHALEKSRLYSTQSYAKKITDDYTNLIEQLRQLAKDKNLDVSSQDELTDRAISLTKRDDNAVEDQQERFDLRYARQELASHERAMSLFHQAAQSNDYDVKEFAQRALVVLEKHRKRAEQLIAENDNSTPPEL